MTRHYSALSLLKEGLTGQKGWVKAWESPQPKPRYDMVILPMSAKPCQEYRRG